MTIYSSIALYWFDSFLFKAFLCFQTSFFLSTQITLPGRKKKKRKKQDRIRSPCLMLWPVSWLSESVILYTLERKEKKRKIK